MGYKNVPPARHLCITAKPTWKGARCLAGQLRHLLNNSYLGVSANFCTHSCQIHPPDKLGFEKPLQNTVCKRQNFHCRSEDWEWEKNRERQCDSEEGEIIRAGSGCGGVAFALMTTKLLPLIFLHVLGTIPNIGPFLAHNPHDALDFSEIPVYLTAKYPMSM